MDIAIICPLSNVDATYSLTTVIRTQHAVLTRHGHKVTIIVNEDFQNRANSGIPTSHFLRILPVTTQVDYRSKLNISEEHEQFAAKVAQILAPRLPQFGVIFTHDLILTGHFLPFALAIMSISADNEALTWYHWIHSAPITRRDWFDLRHYSGSHIVVYPTSLGIPLVKEAFNTENVICVPHIVDYRSVHRFSEPAREIVDLIPALQTADVVQIYPAATDRFESKGIRELTNLFGLLKRSGRSVCLVIANQFAGRRDARLVDPVYYYEKVARRCGLVPYTDYIFTSELYNGKYKEGLPQKILLELMTLANLFVIPSKSESFGLGLLEALVAGGAICVANEHLNLPIKQHTSFDFKTFNSEVHAIDINDLTKLTDWIIEELESNQVVKTKTLIRQQFNPVTVYNQYYKSILQSKILWD